MILGYRREDVNVVEWHCSYSKAAHILDEYVQHATNESSNPVIVDVGCGLSSMGLELVRSGSCRKADMQLYLIDISPELVENLRHLHVADSWIHCSEGDCRRLKELKDGCASLVIDKGTLDALCGEQDKISMLKVLTLFGPGELLSIVDFHAHRT